jgi:ferredoxin-thioredoxin reductase catalytic subunit
MLKKYPDAIRRVGIKRFQSEFAKRMPDADISSLLEFLTDRGVVSRRWRLGPCSSCMQKFWTSRAEISRAINCPGCGKRIKITKELRVGYELHPLVRRAIEEGLPTVALTARFLESLTSKGFLWLPGCKCRTATGDGDIDIVAACDGAIVFSECKSRFDSDAASIDWIARGKEFEHTIALAERAHASLVVYASLLDSYPADFTEWLKSRVKPPLNYLLLGRGQLELGYGKRTMEKDGTTLPLRIRDCIVDPMPEKPQPSFEGKGEIKTPFYTSTFG